MDRIATFLTFQENGMAAVDFYTDIFPNSEVHSSMVRPDNGQLLHASFSLDGQTFMAMDGGPTFSFELGTSLLVSCETQDEVDYYWDSLGKNGEYLQCGWLKDQFGLAWQIVPTALGRLMSSDEPDRAARVHAALLTMTKIEIDVLQRAFDGE